MEFTINCTNVGVSIGGTTNVKNWLVASRSKLQHKNKSIQEVRYLQLPKVYSNFIVVTTMKIVKSVHQTVSFHIIWAMLCWIIRTSISLSIATRTWLTPSSSAKNNEIRMYQRTKHVAGRASIGAASKVKYWWLLSSGICLQCSRDTSALCYTSTCNLASFNVHIEGTKARYSIYSYIVVHKMGQSVVKLIMAIDRIHCDGWSTDIREAN